MMMQWKRKDLDDVMMMQWKRKDLDLGRNQHDIDV